MEKFDQLRGEEFVDEWPRYSPQDLRRKEAVILAAKMCMNAALTAPFGGGVPQVTAHLVYGQEELEKVALKMEELAYGKDAWKRRFLNEAVMVRESDVILFLGNYRAAETPMDANCGACGGSVGCSFFYTRRDSKDGLIDVTDRRSTTPIKGPLCAVRTDDLGYAVGSAMWMSQTLLVDARPFFSVGLAGLKLGYCPRAAIIVGIPMATLSKSPYQDINIDYHLVNMGKVVDNARRSYVTTRQSASGINFDYRTQNPKTGKEGS